MSKLSLSGFGRYVVPLVIVSVLFVAFAYYYFYWVPDRQRHLDDRGFRYLKTLSDQIRLTLNTYDKMLDNAVDSRGVTGSNGVDNEKLDWYLKLVAPQLIRAEPGEVANVINQDYGDPPKLAVASDEGTHFLYLAFLRSPDDSPSKEKPAQLAVRTDLDKLINGLLGPPDLSPFDVMLLAQRDGKVIFQKSLSGVEVAAIKNLEDASGQAKGSNEKKIDIDLLSPTSQLEEVRIAGARYRLYSQPLPIGFPMANPKKNAAGEEPKKNKKGDSKAKSSDDGQDATDAGGNSNANSDDTNSANWVICGLVRADRFRSESQLIPYFYILTMLAIILLAATSFPYLRLYLSIPGERLRARDVALTALATCFVAAVVTFILADFYFWTNSFGPDAEADMAKLASAMNANFQREQQAAFVELNEMDANLGSTDAKLGSLQAIRTVNSELNSFHQPNVSLLYSKDHSGLCKPQNACKVNILTDKLLYTILRKYPYPFYAFWSDVNGNQRIKWTTRQQATPFVALDDASIPYYPDVKLALKNQGDPEAVPTLGIGSQYSPTTGQNITTFWKIVTHESAVEGASSGNADDGQKKPQERICASLVTQPISLFNAVLPGAYQFAVLTPEGTVVFHSDPTRNLRENFLAETDQNPNLRSRVQMRSEGPVTANYRGRPHRMYVLPMAAGNQNGRWTLVIFRDLHLEEVMNLEILSLVSILFILYAVLIALVMWLSSLTRKHHADTRWFWPDSRNAGSYGRIVFANLGSLLLLLVLSRFVSQLVLLACTGLISAATVLLNIVLLTRNGKPLPATGDSGESSLALWQPIYFAAAATLVVALAVVPCLCFFKVAANFEQRLFIEHTLLRLATDFENRASTVQQLYQEVDLGLHKHDVLAGPERQSATGLDVEKQPKPEAKPVFSYHQLLKTQVSMGREPLRKSPDSSEAENQFFSALSYPYNERAADDRHLAEGGSDVWRWTSKTSGRERTLELTKELPSEQVRTITTSWEPFFFPWGHLVWLVGTIAFLGAIYWLVRFSLTRIFLLNLVEPPPAHESGAGFNPESLMADLPMNLLLIGHESSRPISELLHRRDIQVHEAEELLHAEISPAQPEAAAAPVDSPIDGMIRDGRPLILQNFERIPDDAEKTAKANAALMRLLSALGNSVILVSSLDPALIPAIEESDRWRTLLHSFVRIDLNTTPRQRLGETDADYQSRVSAESYFHWLFAGLPKLKKLVMLQLAQEKLVNPNSSEIVYELMEQGMIERRHGLLTVKDEGFAKFLKHALPHHTVKHWEKELAGARPFPLQTSLMIVGVGVAAFLLYTQGDVFNTWVTYATGVAATVPKVLQFFDNLRGKPAGGS